VEVAVVLGELPGCLVFEAVMGAAQRAEVSGGRGSFGPRNCVVQIRVPGGVLASGESAFSVACADEVVECGRWPVGVPGVFQQ
jgi:hypothetical protein